MEKIAEEKAAMLSEYASRRQELESQLLQKQGELARAKAELSELSDLERVKSEHETKIKV